MTKTVRPLMAFSKALCTSRSLSVSKWEVASSKIKISGFFKSDRAIASRWRHPFSAFYFERNLFQHRLARHIFKRDCVIKNFLHRFLKINGVLFIANGRDCIQDFKNARARGNRLLDSTVDLPDFFQRLIKKK